MQDDIPRHRAKCQSGEERIDVNEEGLLQDGQKEQAEQADQGDDGHGSHRQPRTSNK